MITTILIPIRIMITTTTRMAMIAMMILMTVTRRQSSLRFSFHVPHQGGQ